MTEESGKVVFEDVVVLHAREAHSSPVASPGVHGHATKAGSHGHGYLRAQAQSQKSAEKPTKKYIINRGVIASITYKSRDLARDRRR
jgi:hypothetical protein